MGREQGGEINIAEGLDNKKMRRRRRREHWTPLRVSIELLQSARQRVGITGRMRAGLISSPFTLSKIPFTNLPLS